MKANIYGRHSVDFRLHPCNKVGNVRNTASSQSNNRKNLKNKRNPNMVQIPRRSRAKTDSQYLRKSAQLSQLLSTVIKLEKEKSEFGSNLGEIERITEVMNELNTAPVSLCHRLIRVIVSKQLNVIFPQVGRLVTSVMNLLQQSKGQPEISRVIENDIQKLQKELLELKKDESQMRRSFQEGGQDKSEKIQSLLETIKLQNLELQQLKGSSVDNLQQTRHKLSNNRYTQM